MDIIAMFLFALMPVLCLIVALCGFKFPAFKASFLALVICIAEAMVIWNMPALSAATAVAEGIAMALWPIVLVIVAAVFTYNVTVHTGAMDVIKRMITSVSTDKRVLSLLIGWCFGGFLEGMAGFGTAISIPASMLYAFGFDPIVAILVCLLANGCPTMFGSIGIPTTTMAAITGLNSGTLAFVQSIMSAPLMVITPFLMVMMVSGGLKGLKGMVPTILVSSLSFVLPEIVSSYFVGAELPVVIGSVCSLVATFGFAYKQSGHAETPEEYRMNIKTDNSAPITLKDALEAWSPFILIFVLLLMTSKLVPWIHIPLSSIKSSFMIYQGEGAAPSTFTWINTPGVLILISGIIGAKIQKCSTAEILKLLKGTTIQMSKTIITMFCILSCAKVMGYSGMISSISVFFVTMMGSLYPLAAPMLGALGAFVTGSGTSSAVLFGNVQFEAAQAIGSNAYWLVASNALGVGAGKMMASQSIAIGCASCGQFGKDGEILKKIAPYAFAYLAVMALLVYFGVPVAELLSSI